MHIHALLKEMAATDSGPPPFVVQIGAMDGVRGDPVHDALVQNDWPALLVEPIDEHFQTLKQTYAHRPLVTCANVAVADRDGPVTMYMIDPAHEGAASYPAWAPESASLYQDRTALHWDKIAPMVNEVAVDGVTLPTLLERYDVTRVDVLQIDAEGADYLILSQLDFSRFSPQVINLEIVNLPEDEQRACRSLLDRHGYRYQKTGYDLVAVRD